jgi:hypothetical protein
MYLLPKSQTVDGVETGLEAQTGDSRKTLPMHQPRRTVPDHVILIPIQRDHHLDEDLFEETTSPIWTSLAMVKQDDLTQTFLTVGGHQKHSKTTFRKLSMTTKPGTRDITLRILLKHLP